MPQPAPTSLGFRSDTNFEVPFAGVYIAFTKGGFFADGQVRADFYQNEVSDSANGLFGQQFDGRGVAVTGIPCK